MRNSVRNIARAAIAGFVLLGAAPAHAGWITFDFNTVSLTGSTATTQNANVQTYMNNVLAAQAPGTSVVVTGAKPTNSYTGDGHVVGTVSGSTVIPLTLGTTDGGNPTTPRAGAPDIFLNTENSTEIDVTFSKKIYGITFDYEIFPNAQCPTPSNCPTVPDFGFWADGVRLLYTTASAPVAPNNKSPLKPTGGELAPQLGPKNVSFTFAGGVTALRFVDWPVVIGIDNLKVNTSTPVPEPGTMLLLGSGLAAAYARRRQKRQQTSSI